MAIVRKHLRRKHGKLSIVRKHVRRISRRSHQAMLFNAEEATMLKENLGKLKGAEAKGYQMALDDTMLTEQIKAGRPFGKRKLKHLVEDNYAKESVENLKEALAKHPDKIVGNEKAQRKLNQLLKALNISK